MMTAEIAPKRGTPILRATDIVFAYRSNASALRALDGVSIEIRAGEILLLTGPSGSGKSTLLQILGCLLRPDRGRVSLRGRDLWALRGGELSAVRLRHFGFVFQGYNLFPTLTSAENVAVALDLHGVRGRDGTRRSEQLLASVGLASRTNAFPGQLSGGQQQRVAIARALAGNPEIILADEPTAALDSASGMQVMQLLRHLADHESRSIVIVTHDARLTPFADRLLAIEDGRLAGANATVFARPSVHRASPAASLRDVAIRRSVS